MDCLVQDPWDVGAAQYNGHVLGPASMSSATNLGSPCKVHRKWEALPLGAAGTSYLERARPWGKVREQ